MKRTLFFLISVVTVLSMSAHATDVPQQAPVSQPESSSFELQSSTKQAYKMKVLIGVIGTNERVEHIAKVVEQDLKLPLEKQTGFESARQQFAKEPEAKSEIKKLFDQGYSLVVFISAQGKDDVTYRVYDATSATMVKGKKLTLSGYSPTHIGHHVAGVLAQEFLGRPIQFGSQLAFCKQGSSKSGKQLFVTDPHALQAYETLVTTQSPKFGLRWFTHDNHTRLYFSEQSPVNVRLMSYDMDQRKTKMVMNFDGLNMQPSFNADGSKVVVCCSQAGSSQLYMGSQNIISKQWVFKRLTHNDGNNISPYLCKNEDIIFCSDFKGRQPQLYKLHKSDGSIEKLSENGYCASPAVCEEQGKIAYIKLINGIAQIFVYDMNHKQHTQITFDQVQKDEPTWSPCGTYLAYSVEQGNYSRIAVRNMVSQEAYFVTAANEQCSSPAWGPALIS